MIKIVLKHLPLIIQMNNVKKLLKSVLLLWMDVLNNFLVLVLIMKQDVLIWLMVLNAFGMVQNVY